jgi:hypothetical protein
MARVEDIPKAPGRFSAPKKLLSQKKCLLFLYEKAFGRKEFP